MAAVVTYGVKLERSDDLRLVGHPGGCTEETFSQWCSSKLECGVLLAVDLFSGAGGLSLGLQEAGWTTALAVDNDEKALQTHRHNFPGLALARDLGDSAQRNDLLKLLDGTEIDLLAGGPPCQPFSRAGRSKIRSLVTAGHRERTDPRRGLWRAFLDIALAMQPRAVLMENVPDMALGDDFSVIRTMVDALERAGYYTQLLFIDAWKYGVPQHRKRLILLARRDIEKFTWPATQTNEPTLSEAIGDLPRLCDTTGARIMDYRKQKRPSDFTKLMRAGMQDHIVWDHMTRPVRDDDRKIFDMMDSTTLYGDLPAEKRRYSAETFDDKYKKLDWHSKSRSITAHIAKDGYWYIHPEELRTLTVREAARIQTFPDRFRFAGTRSDAFRQIGNAVPPLLGRAAARALAPVQTSANPGSSQIAPSRGADIRQTLTAWAELQREHHWYMLPGSYMTPPVAAVAAMLATGSLQLQGAGRAFEVIRGCASLSKADLDQMQEELSTDAGRVVIERFRPLIGKHAIWNDPEEVTAVLRMKSVQKRTFLLLIGSDVLLATQPAIRVAARVAGTESHKVNRLTDGRVDLASLVGAGADAPLRAASLRLLGSMVCRSTDPGCASCPLQQQCVKGSSRDTPQTLF